MKKREAVILMKRLEDTTGPKQQLIEANLGVAFSP
jgi:hypothetical protein